jgi:hypothetical protein
VRHFRPSLKFSLQRVRQSKFLFKASSFCFSQDQINEAKLKVSYIVPNAPPSPVPEVSGVFTPNGPKRGCPSRLSICNGAAHSKLANTIYYMFVYKRFWSSKSVAVAFLSHPVASCERFCWFGAFVSQLAHSTCDEALFYVTWLTRLS